MIKYINDANKLYSFTTGIRSFVDIFIILLCSKIVNTLVSHTYNSKIICQINWAYNIFRDRYYKCPRLDIYVINYLSFTHMFFL